MGSHTLNSVQILITMKYTALLLLGVLHSSKGLCFLNKCSSYWSNAKKNSTITGACAVLFDENCCDTGETNFVIERWPGQDVRLTQQPQPPVQLQGAQAGERRGEFHRDARMYPGGMGRG